MLSILAPCKIFFTTSSFPRPKSMSLFTGGEDTDVIDKRNKLRKQIKANIVVAAANGNDLEGISFMLYQNFFYQIRSHNLHISNNFLML